MSTIRNIIKTGRVNLLHCLLVLVLFAFSTSLWAYEIQVKTRGDLVVGKEFSVSYSLDTIIQLDEVHNFKENKNFELLYGPSTISSVSIANGVKSSTITLTYVFKPLKAGKVELPQLILESENLKISSPKQTVEVQAGNQSDNLQKEKPKEKKQDKKQKTEEAVVAPKEDIKAFVKVELSRNRISEGDTLTLNYKLYTTKEIMRVRSINVEQAFQLRYYRNNLPNNVYKEEVIDGVTYKVIVLQSYILKGLKQEIVKIPEGNIVVEYGFPTGNVQRDFWGTQYEEMDIEEKKIPTEAYTIAIQNLVAI